MKFIFYIAFFSLFFANGQSNDSIPLLEYEVTYSLGKALVKKGYVFNYDSNVYYNTSKTVFLENMERLTTDEVTGIPNINLFSAGDGTENNVSFFKEHRHFGTYSLGNEVIGTEETLLLQKWEPTGKNKNVNGRDCIEMKADFRGRTYLALVDLSVPINFGPWKFNNFPGLPVLIYDTENKLKWTLTQIKKESQENIISFIEKQEVYLKSLKKLTLKEYVNLYDETGDGHSLIVTKLPRDYKREKSSKKRKRGGLELKFEWETKD